MLSTVHVIYLQSFCNTNKQWNIHLTELSSAVTEQS